eukprot:6405459-Alexandrium_andersonii.AAC.1
MEECGWEHEWKRAVTHLVRAFSSTGEGTGLQPGQQEELEHFLRIMEVWVPGREALRLEGRPSLRDGEQPANAIYLKHVRFIGEAGEENERSWRKGASE